YGLFLMSGKKSEISAKKLLINPGIIGVTAGLLLALLSIKLPAIIAQPVSYLAALNTPLPMIIIGFYIAQLDFKVILSDCKKYLAIILRLVAIPLVAIGIMMIFGVHGKLLVVCAIASSAPPAAMTTMFSTKFNRDTKLSAELVSISTLISMITMPLIVGFAQYLS
ncbi:MAG: AEC family transporter, partial [Oscillospiraceae bacterium]